MKKLRLIITLFILTSMLVSCAEKPMSDDVSNTTLVQNFYDHLYSVIICDYNRLDYHAVALGESNVDKYFTTWGHDYSWNDFEITDETVDVRYYESRDGKETETETGTVFLNPRNKSDDFILVKTDYAYILFRKPLQD